jgi:hypothetical protein
VKTEYYLDEFWDLTPDLDSGELEKEFYIDELL